MPGEQDTSSALGKRLLFLSYSGIDDKPPPDDNKLDGSVTHLRKHLVFELETRGLGQQMLWWDCAKLRVGDSLDKNITEALEAAELLLIILSPNYFKSQWCALERDYFRQRFAVIGDEIGRILRVDKRLDREHQDILIRLELNNVLGARFFSDDDETLTEFYWRGEFFERRRYMQAVGKLADSIYDKLRTIIPGIMLPTPSSDPAAPAPGPGAGRTVFVALPAADMRGPYEVLCTELGKRDFNIVPPADADLPENLTVLSSSFAGWLAGAEIAIHLLGERLGAAPAPGGTALVPLQLGYSRDRAAADSVFRRLLWAPKAWRTQDDQRLVRDPLEIAARFAGELSAADQVEGDTAARFNQFVLQTLLPSMPLSGLRALVLSADCDLAFASRVTAALRPGIRAELPPTEGDEPARAALERRQLAAANLVVVCWAEAQEASIRLMLERDDLREWRAAAGRLRRLALVVGGLATESKKRNLKLPPIDVDDSIDAMEAPLPTALARLLDQYRRIAA